MKRHILLSLFVGALALTVAAPVIAEETAAETAPAKAPPLPFHTIEGVGGGAITPIAYLVNQGPNGQALGLPSLAFSTVGLGEKNLQAFTLTETLFGRVELGYGADRLALGTLPSGIQTATGVDIKRDDVWLHHFNLRVLALPEGSFKLPLPALTAGVHFKLNDGISSINNRLGGALDTIGYHRDHGEDFTLTASKAFTQLGGHPLILTAGGRLSEAANLGFLGFSDHWNATFEGNAVFLPTSWFLVAYEFRQKADPYNDKLKPLVNGEDDWHALDVSWLINSHATLVGGYGILGTLANSKADNAWWLQIKYEI